MFIVSVVNCPPMKTLFHGLLKKMDVKITAEVLTSVLKELEIKLLYIPEKKPRDISFL